MILSGLVGPSIVYFSITEPNPAIQSPESGSTSVDALSWPNFELFDH